MTARRTSRISYAASDIVPASAPEARALGVKHYFTGAPCLRGHVTRRLTANWTCLGCIAEKQAAHNLVSYAWGKANPEKHKASRAAWNAKPGSREKINAASRARWAKSADPNAANRLWIARNPERARITKVTIQARRRARAVAAGGDHNADDILRLKALQRGRCAFCFVKLMKSFQVDHIEPIARGGTNDRANLQLLCKPCNSKKWAKCPIVFAQNHGRLL